MKTIVPNDLIAHPLKPGEDPMAKAMILNTGDAWLGDPSISEGEAGLLAALSKALCPKVIVEVGTGVCRGLFALSSFKGAKLYSCDIDNHRVESARKMLPDAIIVNGTSDELAKAVQESPNLIFIDGDHSYYWAHRDWVNMKGLVRGDCLCVFHDVNNINPGVCNLMRELGAFVLPTTFGMGFVMIKAVT